MATWDVNLNLFELSYFNITYFTKPEQDKIPIIIVNTTTYQISDLIPGENYTVHVTAYYNETNNTVAFPAHITEGTVTLDRIGMYVNNKCFTA